MRRILPEPLCGLQNDPNWNFKCKWTIPLIEKGKKLNVCVPGQFSCQGCWPKASMKIWIWSPSIPQRPPTSSQKVRGQIQRTHFIIHWNSHFYLQFNHSLYLGNSGVTYRLNRQPPQAWQGGDGKACSDREEHVDTRAGQRTDILHALTPRVFFFLLRWHLCLILLYKQSHIMVHNWVCAVFVCCLEAAY